MWFYIIGVVIITWVKNLFHQAKVSLVELNLFDNHLNDPLEIRRGRSGTRLYLLLLTVSITVIVIYTFFSSRTVTKTIESPSLYQYELLQGQYPDTLYCPCSVISVPYADLMQITPIYHQVCGSSLVQTLINVQSTYYPKPVFPAIFAVFTKSYFRTLSALCDIANQTIAGALRQFFSTAFINSHVLSRNLYMSQTNVLMNTFLNLTRVELSYNFLLINTLVSGDQYLSALRSNMLLDLVNLPWLGLDVPNPLRIVPKTRRGTENDGQACSCARDRHCNLADEFPDGYGSHSVTMRSVPWLYLDCFIVDSVLKSSLICWYNRTCITEIIDEVFQSNADYFNVTELNAAMPSRFLLNTTTDIIFDDLMVEQWSLFSSYPAFYQKCNPTHCSFTYTEHYSIIYIITTVISLFGGLSIALRWISFAAARILLTRVHTSDSNDASMPNINQPTTNRK